MTYFHTRMCTIIGAKAFHCPVRDGEEWDHLAMVVRRSGLGAGRVWPAPQFGRSTSRPGWGGGAEPSLNGSWRLPAHARARKPAEGSDRCTRAHRNGG